MTPQESNKRALELMDLLLARNDGEIEDWPLPEKLRMLAAWFYGKEGGMNVSSLHTNGDGVQRDLVIAADLLEEGV